MMNNGSSNGSLDRLTFNLHGSVKLSPQSVLNTPSNISVASNNNHDTSSESVNSRRNKRKNFKPRNICVYDDDEDNEDAKSPDNVVNYPNDDDMISKQDDSLLIQDDDDDEGDEDIDRRPVKRLRLDHRESMSSEGSSYSSPVNHASSMHTLIPEIDGNHFLLRGNNSNQNNNNPKNSVHSNNNHENVDENAGQSSSRCNASNNKSQFEALDLSQSQDNSKEGSCSGSPSPDDVASSLRDQQVFPTRTSSTSPSKDDSSRRPSLTPTSSQSTYNPFPSSMIGLDVDHHNLQYHRSPHSGLGSEKGSLGFWRPGVISGIAPWIDPVYLNQTGAMASKIDALQRAGAVDYTRYVKRYANAAECDSSQCHSLNYREHFHCLDCNSRVFVKKEEMIRHFKWHKKRDESLQHGFMRYSPCDDCCDHFRNCAHNRKQTHYHCLKRGCEKTYISTSDVQMHANYHRKDTAIIQEGFQRFRATEDCLTDTCPFMGQKTTHFHCRRGSCNFTFKNKADMEKHKSFHIKDEQLTRDGFKKFTKHEPCPFGDCKFSGVCNHIHCIRQGCNHVFHSSGQLYSHKRKHDKSESDAEGSPSAGDANSQHDSDVQFNMNSSSGHHHLRPPSGPSSLGSLIPPPTPICETYPTGTTLTSIDGLPVFKRKRGRPPKNQVQENIALPQRAQQQVVPQQPTQTHRSHASSSPSLKNFSGTSSPHHLSSQMMMTSKPVRKQASPSTTHNNGSPNNAIGINSSNPFHMNPLALNPFLSAMNGSNTSSSTPMMNFASPSSFQEGLIPVPMLPLLQLFNLPMNPSMLNPSHPLYSLQSQLTQMQSQGLIPPGLGGHFPINMMNSGNNNFSNNSSPHMKPPATSTSSEGNISMDNMSDDGNDDVLNHRSNSSPNSSSPNSRLPVKDEPVPEGYRRYRFNEDCNYTYCSYREHQTHFHCLRKACGYSFCDKTRFVQHTARHSKLDALMGEDFVQYRSNVKCDYQACPYSGVTQAGLSEQSSSSNKGSHFHCLKCDFVCTDTNRVTGHRKQHHKMDSINAAGFEKYTPSQDCGVNDCLHIRKQTHYHCLKCQYTVLGLSQMSSHKYKHTQEG